MLVTAHRQSLGSSAHVTMGAAPVSKPLTVTDDSDRRSLITDRAHRQTVRNANACHWMEDGYTVSSQHRRRANLSLRW